MPVRLYSRNSLVFSVLLLRPFFAEFMSFWWFRRRRGPSRCVNRKKLLRRLSTLVGCERLLLRRCSFDRFTPDRSVSVQRADLD